MDFGDLNGNLRQIIVRTDSFSAEKAESPFKFSVLPGGRQADEPIILFV